MSAEEAQRAGLISKIYPDNILLKEALNTAKTIGCLPKVQKKIVYLSNLLFKEALKHQLSFKYTNTEYI